MIFTFHDERGFVTVRAVILKADIVAPVEVDVTADPAAVVGAVVVVVVVVDS